MEPFNFDMNDRCLVVSSGVFPFFFMAFSTNDPISTAAFYLFVMRSLFFKLFNTKRGGRGFPLVTLQGIRDSVLKRYA